MKQPRYARASRSRGFTLVETILVIVLLAVVAVGITSIQGTLFSGVATVKGLQVRTALMMECAEQVLAVRRINGYAAANTTTNACGGLTTFAGYTVPSVTFTDPYTGTGCPTNGICKLVSITQSGMTPLTLLLVDY